MIGVVGDVGDCGEVACRATAEATWLEGADVESDGESGLARVDPQPVPLCKASIAAVPGLSDNWGDRARAAALPPHAHAGARTEVGTPAVRSGVRGGCTPRHLAVESAARGVLAEANAESASILPKAARDLPGAALQPPAIPSIMPKGASDAMPTSCALGFRGASGRASARVSLLAMLEKDSWEGVPETNFSCCSSTNVPGLLRKHVASGVADVSGTLANKWSWLEPSTTRASE